MGACRRCSGAFSNGGPSKPASIGSVVGHEMKVRDRVTERSFSESAMVPPILAISSDSPTGPYLLPSSLTLV